MVVSGDSGFSETRQVAAGGTVSFDVPGTYETGTLPIGAQPNGFLYTIAEPDPRGGVATVEPDLVAVTDRQVKAVALGNRYDEGEPEIPPEPPIGPPIEPPVEPGFPGEPPLPPVDVAAPGQGGADLAISETFSRPRVPLGGTFGVTVRVRNQGTLARGGDRRQRGASGQSAAPRQGHPDPVGLGRGGLHREATGHLSAGHRAARPGSDPQRACARAGRRRSGERRARQL